MRAINTTILSYSPKSGKLKSNSNEAEATSFIPLTLGNDLLIEYLALAFTEA